MEPVYFPIIGIARLTHFLQGLKIKFSGAENIPATGGAVLAMNHTGYTEFIYAHIPAREHKRYVRYMAKKEVFDSKVTGPIMRALKHIPVDRSHGADRRRPRGGGGSLDSAAFTEEITELLLDASGDLTAKQIVAIRQRVTDFAVGRGWVLD